MNIYIYIERERDRETLKNRDGERQKSLAGPMGHCEFVQGSNMDINSAAVPPDVVASCRCKHSSLPF